MITHLGILGYPGRLARAICEAAAQRGQLVTVLPRDPEGMMRALRCCESVIDASAPEGTLALAHVAAESKKPLIIATTGHSQGQLAQLKTFSHAIPILKSPNFALGAVVLQQLMTQACTLLEDGYELSLMEMHRQGKKDSPSGTALALAEQTDRPCPITSLRLADNPGEHTVYLAGHGERIQLTHVCYDRKAYAYGALRAAHWLTKQAPGWYSMEDFITSFSR